MSKYLSLEVSDEYQTLIAVIEWNEELARVVRKRIELAKTLHSDDDSLAQLSFYDNVDLFEYGPWFDTWREAVDAEDNWDDGGTILSDERPPDDDAVQVRVDTALFSASQYGFWWDILPRHASTRMETKYLSLTDGLTKKLLEES